MIEKIKNFFTKNKKLSFEDIPKWGSKQCYYCGKNVEDDYWAEFREINGKVYSVAVCDNCSPHTIPQKPTKESI